MYGWIKIGVKMGQTDRASSLVLFFLFAFEGCFIAFCFIRVSIIRIKTEWIKL